ncbi:hypothetical protein KC573_00150, partial [candidate division WWE3 bacterium]|nr:hypothetical protein [candidate division WWE3 bacterium]
MGAIISIAIIIVSILGFSSWYFFQHEPPIDSSNLVTEITAVPTQTNEDHGGVKLSTLDGTPIIS